MSNPQSERQCECQYRWNRTYRAREHRRLRALESLPPLRADAEATLTEALACKRQRNRPWTPRKRKFNELTMHMHFLDRPPYYKTVGLVESPFNV